MGEPSDTLGNHTVPPEHVVCTVHPQITVDEFLSVINTSCKQSGVGNTNSVQRVDCGGDKTDEKVSKQKLSEEERTERPASDLKSEKLSHEPSSSQTDPQDDLFLLAGLHTCADLGPTMLRVFAQCKSAKALASVACCYMKMGCAVENSLSKSKSKLAPGDSLQTGGLFANDINVGKFESYPTQKLFASNDLSASDDKTETDSILDSQSNTSNVTNKPGFPMSAWVKGQNGCDLDFEPLELACHSFDVYHKRLKG